MCRTIQQPDAAGPAPARGGCISGASMAWEPNPNQLCLLWCLGVGGEPYRSLPVQVNGLPAAGGGRQEISIAKPQFPGALGGWGYHDHWTVSLSADSTPKRLPQQIFVTFQAMMMPVSSRAQAAKLLPGRGKDPRLLSHAAFHQGSFKPHFPSSWPLSWPCLAAGWAPRGSTKKQALQEGFSTSGLGLGPRPQQGPAVMAGGPKGAPWQLPHLKEGVFSQGAPAHRHGRIGDVCK